MPRHSRVVDLDEESCDDSPAPPGKRQRSSRDDLTGNLVLTDRTRQDRKPSVKQKSLGGFIQVGLLVFDMFNLFQMPTKKISRT
jgi:hypothetical protein